MRTALIEKKTAELGSGSAPLPADDGQGEGGEEENPEQDDVVS